MIRSIAPGDPRWDTYVRAHPRATAWHLSTWNAILAEAYRWRPASLAQWDGDRITGVLPLVGRRGPVSGRRLRSLPVAATAGPIADDRAGEAALLRAAAELATDRGYALAVSSRSAGLEEGVTGLRCTAGPPSWVLQVPDDHDAWLRARSSRLRRSVRRAERDGVTVREATSAADLRTFHRLYLGTMRMHLSPPRTWQQFALMHAQLAPPGILRLFLAEHGGRPVAGTLWHAFGGTLELIYNASDRDALEHRPNHALYDHATRWAREQGLRAIDYGWAWPQSTLGEFKAQWGAEPVGELLYTLGEQEASGVPGEPDTAVEGRVNAVRSVVGGAWDRAPLPLTAAAGRLAQRWL